MSDVFELLKSTAEHFKKAESPFYVGLVVFNQDLNKVLLGCRREDGIWTGPGGGADMGELPKEAAIRELWEEAKISASPEMLFELPTLDAKNDKKCHCFMLQMNDSQEVSVHLDPDEEVSAWGWYSVNQPLPEPMNDGRKQNVLNAIAKINGIEKAMAINEELHGVNLNTAEYSMDDMASKDHPMVSEIDEMMRDAGYGDIPKELDVGEQYKLILYRADDGVYSGHIKDTETGEMRFKIEKMNTPSIVQALKAKGYLEMNGSDSDAKEIGEQVKDIVEEHEEEWEDRDGTPEEQAADAAAFEQIEELVDPDIHEEADEGFEREELAEILDAFQGRGVRDIHIHFHKAVQGLFEKSLGEYFEKAKKLPLGTVRKHGGEDYKKVAEGKWVKVTDPRQGEKENEEASHERAKELKQMDIDAKADLANQKEASKEESKKDSKKPSADPMDAPGEGKVESKR